jgi:hypothetical protein
LELHEVTSTSGNSVDWPCHDPAAFFGMKLRYAKENRSFVYQGGKWIATEKTSGPPICPPTNPIAGCDG